LELSDGLKGELASTSSGKVEERRDCGKASAAIAYNERGAWKYAGLGSMHTFMTDGNSFAGWDDSEGSVVDVGEGDRQLSIEGTGRQTVDRQANSKE
jgi:hypothetical protein